jgi:hypothetical protein
MFFSILNWQGKVEFYQNIKTDSNLLLEMITPYQEEPTGFRNKLSFILSRLR